MAVLLMFSRDSKLWLLGLVIASLRAGLTGTSCTLWDLVVRWFRNCPSSSPDSVVRPPQCNILELCSNMFYTPW